jgi:hypothetical protein
MKLYTQTYNYQETIEMAKKLEGEYNDPLLFHCFWNGSLNIKHYFSVLSCFYFNIVNRENRKIILWTDSKHEDSDFLRSFNLFCEIRYFDFVEELKDSGLPNNLLNGNPYYSYVSDRIRHLLLYKYGGVWFDLDMVFLRNIDPLISNFKNEIMVYTWSDHTDFPNGAIFINTIPKNPKMKHFIDYVVDKNQGFGFQEADLKFDSPVDLLVLPCSWFDGVFLPDFVEYKPIPGVPNKIFFESVDREVTLDNFCQGAFTYHWHNLWNYPIEQNSYFHRLYMDLTNKINSLK